MEEVVTNVISEEALEKVAGGLKLPPITLKTALIAAGVTIGAIGAVGATSAIAVETYKHYKKNKKDATKD